MSQFENIDVLAARAREFDKDLPMGPVQAEVEAALWGTLTTDLPAAPAWWFASQLAPIAADPAQAADLIRRLLAAQMQAIGRAAAEGMDDGPAWPFNPDTGAPVVEQPIPNVNLAKALVAAGRGQRVHPLCSRRDGAARCDCSEHSEFCKGQKPRWADWKKQATTKPNQLFAWWAKWPHAEPGLAGGGGQGAGRDKRDAAHLFLAEMLDDEFVAVSTLQAEAQERGISWSTVRRAKAEMGIEIEQVGARGGQWWEWRWPRDKQPHTQDLNADTATVEAMRNFLAGNPA